MFSGDNISAIIFEVTERPQKDVIVGVFDGHGETVINKSVGGGKVWGDVGSLASAFLAKEFSERLSLAENRVVISNQKGLYEFLPQLQSPTRQASASDDKPSSVSVKPSASQASSHSFSRQSEK